MDPALSAARRDPWVAHVWGLRAWTNSCARFALTGRWALDRGPVLLPPRVALSEGCYNNHPDVFGRLGEISSAINRAAWSPAPHQLIAIALGEITVSPFNVERAPERRDERETPLPPLTVAAPPCSLCSSPFGAWPTSATGPRSCSNLLRWPRTGCVKS
jgi:hypothetical protein